MKNLKVCPKHQRKHQEFIDQKKIKDGVKNVKSLKRERKREKIKNKLINLI